MIYVVCDEIGDRHRLDDLVVNAVLFRHPGAEVAPVAPDHVKVHLHDRTSVDVRLDRDVPDDDRATMAEGLRDCADADAHLADRVHRATARFAIESDAGDDPDAAPEVRDLPADLGFELAQLCSGLVVADGRVFPAPAPRRIERTRFAAAWPSARAASRYAESSVRQV